MSFLSIDPDIVSAAAAELGGIGSAIAGANATAASPTTAVLAAAEDEISTAIAHLFGTHAEEFEAISAQSATPDSP